MTLEDGFSDKSSSSKPVGSPQRGKVIPTSAARGRAEFFCDGGVIRKNAKTEH
jgi:hypothetical protein